MIKDFVGRIKATKKLAKDKNVHQWYSCLLHGVIIIFGSSLVLSLYTMSFFSTIWETPIGELAFYTFGLPLLYSIILTYLFLEKIIILEIHLFERINKLVFKSWQRFDMWYFRKYRKTSPLTEYLAKLQMKIGKNKMSKRKRRLIMLSLIAGLIILNFAVRVPILFDSVTNETEIGTEIDQAVEEPRQEDEIVIRVNGG